MHSTVKPDLANLCLNAKTALSISLIVLISLVSAPSMNMASAAPGARADVTGGEKSPSKSATKAVVLPGKTPPGTSTGSWTQDRDKGEKAMHMPDSSGSVYLAAKLNSDSDLINARILLRKSAEELRAMKASGAKATLQKEIAQLVSDFAFLQAAEQANAKRENYSERDAAATVKLKSVSDDYLVLVPAVEKHLGANDPQVVSLKQLQTAFRQSFEDHEMLLKEVEEEKQQQLLKQQKRTPGKEIFRKPS